MKSRISYFNGTAFLKNVTRFAPVWAIYLAGCLLVLLGIISNSQPSAAFDTLEETILLMAVVNMAYALMNGELLFGDLFNPRLCNALHSMPMRREGWFLTNVTSGLCFGFVPHLILAVCFLPRLEWYWTSAFVWLLAVNLEYLFFFALAVFCAFCTGNRFAMALVYGLVNFLSLLAGWLVETLYVPLMDGILFNWEPFELFCPVVRLFSCYDYFDFYDKITRSQGLSEGWIYLIALTVLAVILLVSSLLLYRKRKLESAGDFVAVKGLGPVFRVIYTLTAGAMFHLFSELFLDSGTRIIFLLVGLMIGYFTGHMLVQRQVKVFNGRTFLGFGVLAVVLFGSMGVTMLDPLGIVSWVPEAAQVEYAEIGNDSYIYRWANPAQLTEEEQIQDALEIHREILDGNHEKNLADVYLTYHLKDGRTVYRKYEVNVLSEPGRKLNEYFSDPAYLLGYTDWEAYLDSKPTVQVENKTFTGDEARELLEAIKTDCEAGNMTQDWVYHDAYGMDSYTWIYLDGSFDDTDGYYYGTELTVYEDAVNTVAWLKEREAEWQYDYN